LTSHYFPAHFLGTFPERRVLLASYEASMAESWGKKARDTIEEIGRGVFGGLRVKQDSRASSWWHLEGHEGYMATAGVGGPATGKGANLWIIDDPIKNAEEAWSSTIREKQWDWYRSVVYTRLEPSGAIVIAMARWHEDDLVGRLLAEAREGGDRWDVLRLPALAEEGEAGAADPLGRAPGEPLWPEQWSAAALEAARRNAGPYNWSALYQQRPTPIAGGFFKREWLRYYVEDPPGLYRFSDGAVPQPRDHLARFATVDLAASTKESADFTAIGVWGVADDGRMLLLDLVRARMEGPDIVPAIARVVGAWELSFVGIEKVGFQLALIQEARRAGLPVHELEANKDKQIRALDATPFMAAGMLWLPRAAPWLADFEAELLSFPAAAHDDVVDCATYAVACAKSFAVRASEPVFGVVDARAAARARSGGSFAR
jgi:predicted phage terminase large subunit-like protein